MMKNYHLSCTLNSKDKIAAWNNTLNTIVTNLFGNKSNLIN